MFSKQARFAFLCVAALLTYGSQAFAIKFIYSEYDWQAVKGQAFSVDLNKLVTEVDRTQPITWSSDHLPNWATIDSATGVLSGTPKADSLDSDIFSILAVQGQQGDAAKVYLQLIDPSMQGPYHPVWMTDGITIEGCVGKPLASGDLGLQVMLNDPGTTLPIPEIVISTINKPSWMVEVRKEGGSLYLTGVPDAAGDSLFQARACARNNCSDIPVQLKIKACGF